MKTERNDEVFPIPVSQTLPGSYYSLTIPHSDHPRFSLTQLLQARLYPSRLRDVDRRVPVVAPACRNLVWSTCHAAVLAMACPRHSGVVSPIDLIAPLLLRMTVVAVRYGRRICGCTDHDGGSDSYHHSQRRPPSGSDIQ